MHVQATNSPPPSRLLVETWSDIACPYCYLAKRRLARALEAFPRRDHVDVVWRSFQLMPDLRTNPGVTLAEFLAARKGIDAVTVEQMHRFVAQAGRAEGIEFAFDRVIVANTFDAHRLLHFARSRGRQPEMAERMFAAYFTEGRNIDDRGVLVTLAAEVGLDSAETTHVLESGEYADAVRSDQAEARRLGIDAVPHFLFGRRVAVSGAQKTPVLARALQEAFEASAAVSPQT